MNATAPKSKNSLKRMVTLVVIVGVIYGLDHLTDGKLTDLLNQQGQGQATNDTPADGGSVRLPPRTPASLPDKTVDGRSTTSDTDINGGDAGADAIAAAFAEGRSGVVLECAGRVDRVLPDDNDGSRHQRFILRLGNGHTVLVAHNIDLAPAAPVRNGDRVELRGQYEWNDRGGVLHWTHHDPGGRRPGGWIRHEGKEYR